MRSSLALAFATMLILASETSAQPALTVQPAPTALTYNGKPIMAYLGGAPAFPAAFVGMPLCEGGRSGPDARTSCVLLNADGTGTWENDAGPGQRLPPTPIRWYVLASSDGVVTRSSTDERDTFYVIFEFTQPYYNRKPGDLMAFPANLVKGGPGRVVIDNKFRPVS